MREVELRVNDTAVVYIVIKEKNPKFDINMFDGIDDISICKQKITNADADAWASAISLLILRIVELQKYHVERMIYSELIL